MLEDAYPPSATPNIKTRDVVYHIIQLGLTNKVYIDLTERFSYRSSRGNEYLFICYRFDANKILARTLKTRYAETITEVWRILNNKFSASGVTTNTYLMDNEASWDL